MYVIFIVEFPPLYAYDTIWLNIVGTYESLDDKFHAPTVASSSEFHGSSKLPFRSKSLLALFNRELSLTDVHRSYLQWTTVNKILHASLRFCMKF